jgi:type I restriction enzyme S subunit
MRIVNLKEVTNNLDNRRKPLNQTERNNITTEGLYPYIGANNIQDYVDEYIFDEKILCISEDGGSWGRNEVCSKIYTGKVWVNNHAHVLVSKDENVVILEYLMHYLNYNDLNEFITGTTRGKLTKSNLEKIQIPLPPLEVQKAIAEKLDKADALRKKDQELLAQYDELAQAIFIDMFGDPVQNEKGWEVMNLKELTSDILSGNTPKGGSEVYVEKGITFFRSQNVWKNKLDIEDIAYIDEITHRRMSKSSLRHKDILMTKTGRINTENSSLGRASIYYGKDNSANINGHVYLIRLKSNYIHEYILFILISKSYRNHIRSVCVGGIDKRQLNKEHIENFPIIMPPIDEQVKFSEIFKNIEAQKAIVKQQAAASEQLFQALLQESFNFS